MKTDQKAIIFNKVQGSFVDGWGVRTTIFLKGCPLRCKWCCNPEGQSFKPELKVVYDDCNGCGECVTQCPQNACQIVDGKVVVDRMQCNNCGACREFCYAGALEPFGQECTVEDIFQYLKKDKPFYDATGGGVTIGGGEATCFADFVIPLMEKLHAESISVAIDTCGYVTTEKGRMVLEKADLVLFDIKGLDRERHMANTGIDNTVIWETLHWLDSMQKPIIIRLPIIPGYTDDWEEISDIAERLKDILSIKRIDILPCHHFGRVKYEQIGKAYEISEVGEVPQEYLDQIWNLFTDKGFQTQIGG